MFNINFSTGMVPHFNHFITFQDLYGYSEKSDIYSVGIVMCELGNGEVPYRDMPPTLMLLQKLEDRVPCLYDASTCSQTAENGQGKFALNNFHWYNFYPSPER